MVEIGKTKRLDGIFPLSAQAENHSTGHENLQTRACTHQVRDEGRCVDNLLKVVEDQEYLFLAQMILQKFRFAHSFL